MNRLTIFVYGTLGYVTFLATFLYAIGFIGNFAVPKSMDSPADGPWQTALLVDLGLAPGRSPSVATLHRVFRRLDVAAFEQVLGAWLAQTGIAPDEPFAVDGKTLRGIHGEAIPGVHLVAAYTHRAGAILGQLQTDGKGQEIAAAQALLAQVPLAGRLVTTDALLTQREVAQQVVDGGGDYLLPVKDNQPILHADLATAFSPVAAEAASGRVGDLSPAGLEVGEVSGAV